MADSPTASYFLNGRYKTLQGTLKISGKYSNVHSHYWLEFYNEKGDCIAQTPPAAADILPICFSIEVSHVNELTVKVCGDTVSPGNIPILTEGFSFLLTPL